MNFLTQDVPVLDFRSAARAALRYLRSTCGLQTWTISRIDGDDFILLEVEGEQFDLRPGQMQPWHQALALRAAHGLGPRVENDVPGSAAYRTAATDQNVAVGAFIGVPLMYGDGSLFGMLTAIDSHVQPESLKAHRPLIELISSILSALLVAELRVSLESRGAERARAMALRDALTDLYNRRGWDELLAAEEARCARYAHPACVVSVDLDLLKAVNDAHGHAAGDDLICKAGRIIVNSARTTDVVARVGGDEFVVLAVECSPADGALLAERIDAALLAANVAASVGMAAREPAGTLLAAQHAADQAMYARKRLRQLARTTGQLTTAA